METEALDIPEAIDSTIVALTPSEMPGAQIALIEWCDRTLAQLRDETQDLEEHRAIAKANGWKLSAVERQLLLAKRRLVYYGKVKAAIQAGYLIVPNMPIDVFAIRVDRDTPPHEVRDGRWPGRFAASAQRLEIGDGRYVSPTPETEHNVHKAKDDTGQLVERHYWQTLGYRDVDFPVKAVKPVVLDATARAMALKVFDQLGIVRDNGVGTTWPRRGDPIVVGQLIDPRGNGRGATFFIAWWLDTSTL